MNWRRRIASRLPGRAAILSLAVLCLAAGIRDAPPFSLLDLTGRKVRLSSLRGRVVVVNFWATWCAPCMLEIPDLAVFWRRYHQRCLEVLGVAEDSADRDEIARAVSRLQIPYPVLLDEDGAVADRYRIPGFPRTYVIDVRGKVRRVFDGTVGPEELEAAVKPLLPASSDGCPSPGHAQR